MICELLRAEGLVLNHEGVGRLHYMDLSITAGEAAGLIGLSGSEKTALAEILCGEREPDGGTVLQEGRSLRREQLKQLGIRIGQSSQLPGNLSVADNLLTLGLGGRGLFFSEKKFRGLCRELLAEFALDAWLDEPAAIPPAVQHRLLLVSAAVQGKL